MVDNDYIRSSELPPRDLFFEFTAKNRPAYVTTNFFWPVYPASHLRMSLFINDHTRLSCCSLFATRYRNSLVI